jgi:hypothetical protein
MGVLKKHMDNLKPSYNTTDALEAVVQLVVLMATMNVPRGRNPGKRELMWRDVDVPTQCL